MKRVRHDKDSVSFWIGLLRKQNGIPGLIPAAKVYELLNADLTQATSRSFQRGCEQNGPPWSYSPFLGFEIWAISCRTSSSFYSEDQPEHQGLVRLNIFVCCSSERPFRSGRASRRCEYIHREGMSCRLRSTMVGATRWQYSAQPAPKTV